MPPVTTRFPANLFRCRRGSDRHLHQGRCHRSAALGFFSASALLSGTTPAASTTRTRRRPRTWTTVRPPSPTGRIRPLRVHRLQCDLVPGLQVRQRPVRWVILRLPPGEVDEQIPLPQRLVAAGRHSRAFFRYRYAPTVLAGASHLAQICHGVVPAAHQSQRLPRPRHRHVLQPASFLAIPLVCPRVPPLPFQVPPSTSTCPNHRLFAACIRNCQHRFALASRRTLPLLQ